MSQTSAQHISRDKKLLNKIIPSESMKNELQVSVDGIVSSRLRDPSQKSLRSIETRDFQTWM